MCSVPHLLQAQAPLRERRCRSPSPHRARRKAPARESHRETAVTSPGVWRSGGGEHPLPGEDVQFATNPPGPTVATSRTAPAWNGTRVSGWSCRGENHGSFGKKNLNYSERTVVPRHQPVRLSRGDAAASPGQPLNDGPLPRRRTTWPWALPSPPGGPGRSSRAGSCSASVDPRAVPVVMT
jgi:hypothetical protein